MKEDIILKLTEPIFVLNAARQANKLGDKLLEQGITILIGKLADPEDGRLVSQKTIFSSVQSSHSVLSDSL